MEKEIVETKNPKNPLGRGLRYKVCEICGKRIISQGYGGHLFLQHNVKTGVVARLEEVQKRLDNLEKRGSRSDLNPEVSIEEVQKRLNKLEKMGTSPDGNSGEVLEEIQGRLDNLEKVKVHSLPKPGEDHAEEISSGVIDDLAGKLEGIQGRLEALEGFKARIIGEKQVFGDVALMMTLEDWKESESEESESEESESEESESEESESEESESEEGEIEENEPVGKKEKSPESKLKKKKDESKGLFPCDWIE